MCYADKQYYESTYKGEFVNEPKLNTFLSRASRQIDDMTFNRIVGRGFRNLSSFQQERIQEAVCLQADFLIQYSEYIDSPLSSYSIGDTSISFNTELVNNVTTTKSVVGTLKQTGLMCRRL